MINKRRTLICLVLSMVALFPFAAAAQISTSVTLTGNDLNAIGWPITINGGIIGNPVVVGL